jgi:hypothetical protein
MRLAFFLRSIVLVLIAAGITISWTRVDDPEPVAIDFLNACMDGDEEAIARLSIVRDCSAILKWKRLSAESHRDDQGTISALLGDLEAYRGGRNQLLELVREHHRLFDQKGALGEDVFEERERSIIRERDRILVELERLKEKHRGMFLLLDAGVLSRILGGKRIQDFEGLYDVKIYFYFVEISSVTPREIKIRNQVKIDLAKVSLGNFQSKWLVYKIKDLTD